MICIFFTLIFTWLGGFLFVIVAGLTIPVMFSFLYYTLPIAQLATIETFIEIGLLIYLILTKIFRRNKFFKPLGIIIIIFLAGIAIYFSFSYNKIFLTSDIFGYSIPVFGDLYNLYKSIFNLFSGILDKLLKFFTGK